MRLTLALACALALFGCRESTADSSPASPRRAAWGPAAPGELDVTTGAIGRGDGGTLAIRAPKVRAVVPGSGGDSAELRFVYRGGSDDVARLASGTLRRQLGLKLRAANGCNLVYVMWRIEPEAKLVVSIKQNPGDRVHRECGTRGYRNVRPRRSAPVPPLEAGASHTLRADLDGRELTVRVDGEIVWLGDLGAGVDRLSGPAGLRTDNVEIDGQLFVGAPESPAAAL